MAICKSCGEESDELVAIKVAGKTKKVCDDCKSRLEEEAEIMRDLGCQDAMNLDGGGSTCMNVFGIDMNRPSDKTGERPVANGIVFYGPKLLTPEQKLKITVPSTITTNGTGQAKILDKNGKEIPTIEVFWSMQGTAWIDQGGQITGLEAGTATLQAYVRGMTLTQTVVIK